MRPVSLRPTLLSRFLDARNRPLWSRCRDNYRCRRRACLVYHVPSSSSRQLCLLLDAAPLPITKVPPRPDATMPGTKAILFICALLLFALMAVAAPLPVGRDGVVKKALKQYKAKRGVDAPSRVGREAAAKPSGYFARGANKREEAALPKPSKGYRR
uniref:Uncharacterized protein n=1 Tax=Mycena chlorophos TaxID=658473 RepID=A0ABQ0LLP4_MYCCL|nr:predicted protein [Mycena chlorophos]